MIGVDARGRGLGLGFAVLGSSIAWTIHLLLAWGISEFACTWGVDTFELAGVSGITWSLVALSVLMLALSIASTAYALAMRKRFGSPAPHGEDPDPVPYLVRIGWLLGILFTLTIAAQTLPLAWFLDGC